jgi:hypothetical protein
LVSSVWASTACYLTWKRSITPAGRWLFRLQVSVPRIAATGFGLLHTPTETGNQLAPSMATRDPGSWLLPTPSGQEPGIRPERIVDRHGNPPSHPNQRLYDRHTGRVVQDGITQFVGLWPTPRTEGFDAGSHRGNPDSLHAAVKLFPTPRASPNENRQTKITPSQANGTHGRSLAAEVISGLLPTPMPSDVDGGRTTKGKLRPDEHGLRLEVGGKLSANWVTRLMGYPDGWLE